MCTVNAAIIATVATTQQFVACAKRISKISRLKTALVYWTPALPDRTLI